MFITLLDFLLTPFYVALVYFLGKSFRDRHYPEGHPWRPYFLKGLWFKIGGAIFIGLVYQFLYGGGDTSAYYNQSIVVNEAFFDSPIKWLNLILHIPKGYEGEYMKYFSRLYWYEAEANYMPIRVTALVGIFAFNNYLCTSVLLSGLAFTGLWAMFRTFAKIYPHLVGYIALSFLYIPSVALWGSGIFKDTICMFGLGWMIYAVFQIFVNRNLDPRNIFIVLFSTYLIYVTKIYILAAFVPALAMWILLQYNHKIKSGFIRTFLAPLLIAGVTAAFIQVASSEEILGNYNLDNIEEVSKVTRDYILSSTGESGSTYTLGNIEPGLVGMIKKAPAAINVSLFRPYLWEARKPIVLLNALEASLFLFFTLKILFKLGPLKVWSSIRSDPNIQFCLIFSMIFGLAVGISSYNFGSLSRYRIPMLPLYALSLGLIWYRYKSERFTPFEGKS